MGSAVDRFNVDIVDTTTPTPISPSELPPSVSASISLVPATLLERYQCWHINSGSWRGPFTVPEYIHREAILESQLLTRDARITYWILTDASLAVGKDGARPILASCETLRKEGYLANNGHLERLVTHGIGSVFCRHEYRGRGYASRMMSEVGKILETWQQEKHGKASFSMLWSDIGRSFYAAHGWKAMSSTHISLPPVSGQASLQARNMPSCSGIRDLRAPDLEKRICSKAIAILETQLILQSQRRIDVPHIAIRPDYEHMAWHHAREELQASTLYNKVPLAKGVEDPATGCALIWSRVYGETPQSNKLYILYTLIPKDATGDVTQSIAALLLRAQLEAHKWDMHGGIELWSPAANVIDAAETLAGKEKVQISVRERDSVCSLRWIGGSDKEPIWLANEKYAWC